jgi:ABC-type Zn uptake system ZnuABC Zn-binding protein ZnuA
MLALIGLAVSCNGGNSGPSATGQVRVVTSIELFGDLIQHVGGDRVQVTALVPPGADPHTYEPSPPQAAKVAQADLVVINGLNLEETLHDLIQNNVGSGVPVVEMADGLPVIGASNGTAGNPHLWLNVQNAMHYVEEIRDALIQVDAAGTDTYRANAATYLQELDALDKETAAAIDSIPAERRRLVTFHDSFPYFAQRYGLDLVGVAEESPGQEPSAGDLAALTDKIRAQNVPTVFAEPEFNAAVLQAAAGDAGVKVSTLLSDAYADNVHSYVELIRFDAQQLVAGLGSP